MKSMSVQQLLDTLAGVDALAPAQYRLVRQTPDGLVPLDRRTVQGFAAVADLEIVDGRALIRGRAIDCICDYRTQGPAEYRGEVLIVLEGSDGGQE